MTSRARRPLTLRVTALGLAAGLGLAGCSGQEGTDDESGQSSVTSSADTTSEPSEPGQSSEPSEPSEPGQSSEPSEPSTSASSSSSRSSSGQAAGTPADRPDDPDAGPVTLAVVGDLKLAHRAAGDIQAGRGDRVFAGVADELAAADLTLGNLETALGTGADRAGKVNKKYTFMSPPAAVEVLQEVGFDHVSLANNHVYDFGEHGIVTTLKHLRAAGLPFSGAGEDPQAARTPAVLEANGRRIAVLNYLNVEDDNRVIPFANRDWEAREDRAGVAWGHPEEIAQDVAAVRDEVDDVVVILHAGLENRTQLNDAQRAMADAAFDAGATAVIGHHAHVLQGYDVREDSGTLVAWGLGNFVFDGYPEDAEQNDSAILNLTLDDQGVTDVSFTPVAVQGGYPVALDPQSARGQRILEHLESLPHE